MSYLYLFLFGLLAANGVPHFIKGITGQWHMTPFGKPSSPVVNVLWGGVNFYAAYWVVQLVTDTPLNKFAASLAILIGVSATGVGLAMLWKDDDKARGQH